MLYQQEERLKKSLEIMAAFSEGTGLEEAGASQRRYLWTDAFAVCNFLTLYERSGKEEQLSQARLLIDVVHRTLGYFRDDDERSGALSGLEESQAKKYPTVAGLRIGKALRERAPDEPYDEQKEWDRDGQYFHYLTKWMHALDQ
ncbi:MAG TPA: hypothetical protein ENL04_02560, partial [Sulfuricurvum sp.]|nr:hypothetical protein [Sulfuricurvum sp.]